MSQESKWLIVGFLVWLTIISAGIATRDIAVSKCKVAAIDKGLSASEVAVACKP